MFQYESAATFFTNRPQLPNDPAILQPDARDLTPLLDKTSRPLRQSLEANRATRSEQLSPDWLRLFLKQLKIDSDGNEGSDNPPPTPESGDNNGAGRPRGRHPLASHLKRQRV